MPKPKTVPSYRFHKATGQAIVVIRGRSFYLGKFGTPASRSEYNRIIAEYLTAGAVAPPVKIGSPTVPDLSVDELILRYWDFAEGTTSGMATLAELDNLRDALRHVRPLYGATPAAHFGPKALKTVRKAMIDANLARNTVNYRVGKIRRMFRWAVSEELIPSSVAHGLREVRGLAEGEEGSRETKPVEPIGPEQVAAVLPFFSKPIRAMIQVQDLTGMRPGEVMILRPMDIDRSDDIWVYKPSRHKTQSKGFARAIPIGPKAQAILTPWLTGDPTAYAFRPSHAVAIRNAESRAARRSPRTPSQEARKPKAHPKLAPGDGYGKRAYHRAIERACDKAFPHPTLSLVDPEKFDEAQREELQDWKKAHRWHPNRLRHSAATRIRKAFGLEASQVVLGHAKADVTQVYAERDLTKAVEVMRQMG